MCGSQVKVWGWQNKISPIYHSKGPNLCKECITRNHLRIKTYDKHNIMISCDTTKGRRTSRKTICTFNIHFEYS